MALTIYQDELFFAWLVGWLVFWFYDTGFLCITNNPSCPGTCFIDRSGLELTEPASQVLELKECHHVQLELGFNQMSCSSHNPCPVGE